MIKNELRDAFAKVDRKALAAKLGTSVNYINQIIYRDKLVSFKRALIIEKLTGISKSIFRPDIWPKEKL